MLDRKMTRGHHPFTDEEIISPYTRALLEPYVTWTGGYGLPATVTYGFKTPQAKGLFANPLPPIPQLDNSISFGNMGQHELLVEQGLRFWERVADVKFIRDDLQPELPIYKFLLSRETLVSGFAFFYNDQAQSHSVTGIGLNSQDMNSMEYITIYSPQFGTILHEIGHAGIGLKHPFEDGYVLHQTEKLLKSISVLNYAYEMSGDYRIIPITPMNEDIKAAQYIFGPNLETGRGDDVYLLKDFVPEVQLPYKTIAAIWDASGVDTFSTEGISTPVTVNMNSGARTILPTGFVVIADHVKIENVVMGEGGGKIIPNQEDNLIDLSLTKQAVHIEMESQSGGNDIIFNFCKDKDIITSSGSNSGSTLDFVPGKTCHVTQLGNREIKYSNDLHAKLENTNVTLATIESEKMITPKEFFEFQDIKDLNQETQSLFWIIYNEFPSLLFKDFGKALFSTACMTLLHNEIEDSLKAKGYTEKQIRMVTMLLPTIVLTIYSGAFGYSNLGLIASSMFSIFATSDYNSKGFSAETTSTVAKVVSTIAVTSQSVSQLGLTRGLAATAGSLAGAMVGHWALMWMNPKSTKPPVNDSLMNEDKTNMMKAT